VTRGQLPQRAGSLRLNGGGTAAVVPPMEGQTNEWCCYMEHVLLFFLSADHVHCWAVAQWSSTSMTVWVCVYDADRPSYVKLRPLPLNWGKNHSWRKPYLNGKPGDLLQFNFQFQFISISGSKPLFNSR